jgi:hypothetical protein
LVHPFGGVVWRVRRVHVVSCAEKSQKSHLNCVVVARWAWMPAPWVRTFRGVMGHGVVWRGVACACDVVS